jgi:hypothetical protein
LKTTIVAEVGGALRAKATAAKHRTKRGFLASKVASLDVMSVENRQIMGTTVHANPKDNCGSYFQAMWCDVGSFETNAVDSENCDDAFGNIKVDIVLLSSNSPLLIELVRDINR